LQAERSGLKSGSPRRIRLLADFLNPMMLEILAQAQPAAPAPGPGGGFGFFVPFIFIFIIMYFMLFRPQKKRQQEQQRLISALKTGDKVVTNAGIHGLIANVKETTVILKVADNVKIELEKSAVANVLKES
jgi:preprotein translocase subunit YajC